MIQLRGDVLRRFQAGDDVIFRHLVEEHSPRLYAFVRSYIRDEDEARDALQDMWHRAFEKRHGYRARGTILGWLYTICRTVCLNRLNRRPDAFELSVEQLAAAERYRPDRETEATELRNGIRDAVLSLPDRERDVVIMRLLEQRSTNETATALDMAEGTVKASLHHAVKKLRLSLEAWT